MGLSPLTFCAFPDSSKQSDLERKKADVRKRMEEQSMAKKKKGFMTPERKKKLRVKFRLRRIKVRPGWGGVEGTGGHNWEPTLLS
jgi:hypothetical protein